MNPFNSTPQAPTSLYPSGGQQHEPKKRILQQLMQTAIGGPGKGIHDTVHAIKTALGAYKNYAKEWDSLHGVSSPTGVAPTPGNVSPRQGQSPTLMDIPQPKNSVPPITPPTTGIGMMAQGQTAQTPPRAQNVQPPAPTKLPPVLPPIAAPMPSFMGGGNPSSAGMLG